MKATIKKHKKKVAAGATVVGLVTATLAMWSNIYPAICPLLPGQYKCMQIGAAIRAIDHSMDKNTATLDSMKLDMTVDAGDTDGGQP